MDKRSCESLEHKPVLITDYNAFLNDCCDTSDASATVSYSNLKAQYKIWSKKITHEDSRNMINHFKKSFKSTMLRHNPLVNTSKKTDHFKGLKLKDEFFSFSRPRNDLMVFEMYLYTNCIRSPLNKSY